MKISFKNQEEYLSKLFEKYIGMPHGLIKSHCNYFNEFFNEGKAINIEKLKNLLALNLKGYEGVELYNKSWFGIDIPVWLTNGGNKNKIMITAMDPLREKDNSNKIKPENITFNTPFTIHDIEISNNYNSHITKLAESNDIYLTDAYKLFFRDSKNYDFVSNKIPSYRKLGIHKMILIEEIKHFKPNFILCLGKDSSHAIANLGGFSLEPISKTKIQKQLEKYSFEKIPVFCVPHASGSARGSAKKFMELHNQPYIAKNYLFDVVNLILKKIDHYNRKTL